MSQPNILLMVLDSVRRDALSCYGNEKKTTPNIDALAEEGVKFENHFSAGGYTPVSHAAMFSGQLPSKTNSLFRKNLEADETIASVLGDGGYETFGMRTVAHINSDFGYDRGFDRYYDMHHDFSRKSLNPDLMIDTLMDRIWGRRNRTFFSYRFLKKQMSVSEEPFFGFLNLTTAHRPYRAPRLLERNFVKSQGNMEKVKRLSSGSEGDIEEEYIKGELDITEDDWGHLKQKFYAELYRSDIYIGRLVKHLKKKGEYENTAIIITSDHGDEFGEHGLFQHSHLYDTCLKVPMIIGGGVESEEVEGLTSHLDLKGIIEAISENEFSPGEFTRDHIMAENGGSNVVENEKLQKARSPVKAVRTRKYKLLKRKYSEDELFDIDRDPGEQENIIKEKKEKAEELSEMLPQFGEDTEEREPRDEKIKQRLEHLGYG
jgi:arylsulfatase A-like enzyme